MNADPPAGERALLRVSGMWCGSCARALEKTLRREPGVSAARVGFATGVATVDFDPAVTSPARLMRAAGALGYPAAPYTAEPPGTPGELRAIGPLQVRLAVAVVLGMWTMMAQLVLYFTTPAEVPPATRWHLAAAAGLLATPVVFWSGAGFFRAGWRTLEAGAPGMDLLVAQGAGAAWGLSVVQLARGEERVWFDTAAMLVSFLLAGRLLEYGARRRGADAVRRLLASSPETADRIDPATGAVRTAAATEVRIGDEVRVAPGARVPLDGRVVDGRSTLDRSPLTGESRPVAVRPGDRVHAGCVNGPGALRVAVTAPVGERRVDHIAARVREALDQRPELQALADRVAARLVPAVVVLAALTAAGGALWTGDVEESVLRAVAVLVVTCPCALGLATPIALAVAVGRAAARGVVFRGADALHRAAEVDTVAFDKTGTLTEGRPAVLRVEPRDGATPATLLRLAAAALAGDDHPLARAIRDAADARGAAPDPDPPERPSVGVNGAHRRPPDAADGGREAVPGRGVRWVRPDGTEVRVGARRWAAPDVVATPSEPADATEVWVSVDGRARGRLLLVDALRPEAAVTVARLGRAGVALALLSGDAPGPVARVAAAVGLDGAAEAGRSPEEKADWIARRQAAGARVAFVGDGVNDAPALALAHVGIAVAGATDAATAAAPITLQAGGLDRVAEALMLARRAVRVMRQNLAWAVAYNAVALPLAVAGGLRPAVAALAMLASSLTVTLNALRLGRDPSPSSLPRDGAASTVAAPSPQGA